MILEGIWTAEEKVQNSTTTKLSKMLSNWVKILTSYYAISSIPGHFPHNLLGSACAAKTTATAEKLWEKMFNLCKPQPTCSINIPNTNTGLKPSHFIRSQPFQTTSTQRRGAASTMRTAAKSWKKLLNWGKPQSLSIFNKKSDRQNRCDCRGWAAEKDAKTFSARNTNCN